MNFLHMFNRENGFILYSFMPSKPDYEGVATDTLTGFFRFYMCLSSKFSFSGSTSVQRNPRIPRMGPRTNCGDGPRPPYTHSIKASFMGLRSRRAQVRITGRDNNPDQVWTSVTFAVMTSCFHTHI